MIRLLGLRTLCRVVSRRRFGGRWCYYLRCNFKLQLDGGSKFPQRHCQPTSPQGVKSSEYHHLINIYRENLTTQREADVNST